MASPWIAALFALFVWWFATGAILVAVRHADRHGGQANTLCALATLPLAALGIWGFVATLGGTGPAAVYGAFLSALAIWGWIELAFLTGIVTGPNPHPCPPGRPPWERFIRAWGTLAYNEMLLAAVLAAMLVAGWGAPNRVGLWTFILLYAARVSAKLNLFLGVPRINTEFLPRSLSHLSSHFRIARLNWLFPLSITGLSLALACWLERLHVAGTAAEVAGFALLAALTALALLEHWLMVLPLPDARLWRWMLPERAEEPPKARPGEAHGL